MKVLPINILKLKQRQNSILELYAEKIELISKMEFNTSDKLKNIEILNLHIEKRILQFCVKQKTTTPKIPLFDKELMHLWSTKSVYIYAVLSDNNILLTPLKKVDFVKEMYFVQQSINKGRPVTSADDDPKYIDIMKQERDALEAEISIAKTDIDSVRQRIRLFYVKDAIETRTVKPMKTITKAESDKKIDTQLKKYHEFISLLKEKINILLVQQKKASDLEKIESKIEIFKTEAEIDAKEVFANQYKLRKNILP